MTADEKFLADRPAPPFQSALRSATPKLTQLPQLAGKIDEFPLPTARKSLGRLAGVAGTAM